MASIQRRSNHDDDRDGRGPSTRRCLFGGGSKLTTAEEENAYPESKPETYDLMPGVLGKQTQLQYRKLDTVYDAKKHGWDVRVFYSRVDGKGASDDLAKCRGQ